MALICLASRPARGGDSIAVTNVVASIDVDAAFAMYYKTAILKGNLQKLIDDFNREYEALQAKLTFTLQSQRELEEFTKVHGKILDDRQAALRKEVVDDIRRATIKVARERRFNAVVDKSGNYDGFFCSARSDSGKQLKTPQPIRTKAPEITTEVILLLNQKPVPIPP